MIIGKPNPSPETKKAMRTAMTVMKDEATARLEAIVKKYDERTIHVGMAVADALKMAQALCELGVPKELVQHNTHNVVRLLPLIEGIDMDKVQVITQELADLADDLEQSITTEIHLAQKGEKMADADKVIAKAAT